MHVAVPFDAANPKSRLGSVLDAEERAAFARATLADVLAALGVIGLEPMVYATRELDLEAVLTPAADARTRGERVDGASEAGAPTGDGLEAELVVDDRGLDALCDDLLHDAAADDTVAVVMADLGLATPAALERLFATEGDVVLAPGRGGGTNALVVRDSGFSTDFHGVSLRDHREIAREADLDVAEVDSMRLATDVDEPADLVEVLLHGEGRAAAWLREHGFEVVVEDGRASVARE